MQAIRSVLKLLVELMQEWQHILTEKARGTFHEPVSSAAAKSADLFPLVYNTHQCLPCHDVASAAAKRICLSEQLFFIQFDNVCL